MVAGQAPYLPFQCHRRVERDIGTARRFPRLEAALLEQRLCCIEIACGWLVSPDAILQCTGKDQSVPLSPESSKERCNSARRFASSSASAFGFSCLFVAIRGLPGRHHANPLNAAARSMAGYGCCWAFSSFAGTMPALIALC